MSDHWIAWSGGKRPVEDFRTVQVRHRDGWHDDPKGRPARLWTWNYRSEKPTNIVAYRLVRP